MVKMASDLEITRKTINCPHVEQRIQEDGEDAGFCLAGQHGLVISLDLEGREVLQLCPICAAVVRDCILSRFLNQSFTNGIREAFRRVGV